MSQETRPGPQSALIAALERPLAGSNLKVRRGKGYGGWAGGPTGCGEEGCSISQPQPHLKHAPTLISLGSNLGGMAEVAGVG